MSGKNTDNRNATASWSGYLHQGKVGIFVVLKEVIKILENKNINFEDYRIIYENAEDFDIQVKDKNGVIEDENNEKWKVLSRHQVKAYKDGENLNDYKDVLGIQKYVMKKNKNGEIVKKLEVKGFQIRQFFEKDEEGECEKGEIEVEEENRYLHTICEVKGFGLTKEEYETEQENGNIAKKSKWIDNPNNIKLYEYDFSSEKQNFCKLSIESPLLKEESIKLIKKIRDNFKIIEFIDENKYLELLFLLDEEIRDKHLNGGFLELSFKKIIELIKSNEQFEELENIRLRRRFIEYYDVFKSNVTDKKEIKNINHIIGNILKLYIDDFMKIIYEIHPNKFYSENGFDLNEDGLEEVFFECLKLIDNKIYKKYNFFIKNKKVYFLSTLNKRKSKIKDIIMRIIGNDRISTNIYESDYIVNGYIDKISFGDELKKLGEDEKEKDNEKNNNFKYFGNCRNEKKIDKINSTKLSFVTIDNTIDILNK